MDEMFCILDSLGFPTCFSHGDVHIQNIVYDEENGKNYIISICM